MQKMLNKDEDVVLNDKQANIVSSVSVGQALLSAIPYVGSSLAFIWTNVQAERRFLRIERFCELITHEIEDLKDAIKSLNDFDKNKLASIIEEIFEGVEKDFTEEKVQYFKNCFFNMLINPSDSDYGKRKYFISLINLLSIMEIGLICALYKASEGHGYKGADNYEIIGWLERLKSLGLVQSHLAGTLEPNINWSSISHYRISQFGQEFVIFCLENEKINYTTKNNGFNEAR
jgi:hypothetical protein